MSSLGERFALAQIFRQSCESCGSRVLVWMTGHDAPMILGLGRWAELAVRFPVELRHDLEVWLCSSCGNCGAFSPPEVL